jgi:hypothetical protein
MENREKLRLQTKLDESKKPMFSLEDSEHRRMSPYRIPYSIFKQYKEDDLSEVVTEPLGYGVVLDTSDGPYRIPVDWFDTEHFSCDGFKFKLKFDVNQNVVVYDAHIAYLGKLIEKIDKACFIFLNAGSTLTVTYKRGAV